MAPGASVDRGQIPAPPPDPALPHLAVALGPGAFAELIASRLAESSDGGLELVDCRPVHARYRPGKSALVLYEIVFRERRAGAGLQHTLAHARLGRAGRAASLFERSSFRRLLAQVADYHPGAPQPRAFVVPELDALVQLYPLDRNLPALAAATSPLATASLLGTPGSVDVVRYRPSRRALLRYAAGDAGPAIWRSIFRDDRAGRVDALVDRLRAAGIPVPVSVALPDDESSTAAFEVTGRVLATLAPDDLVAALPAVGEVLGRLHGSALVGPLPSAAVPEAERVAAAARDLSVLLPRLARAVRRLNDLLVPAIERAERSRSLIHGQFHAGHVIAGPGGPVLLDFGQARVGDGHVDLASALARVRLGGTDAHADAAHEALLDGYGRAARLHARRVLLFEAASLLRMADEPFRRLEPEWPEAIERRVALAWDRVEVWKVRRPRRHAAVTSNGRAFDSPSYAPPPVDPALPTLDRLLDRSGMSERLSDALGEPVLVTSATVVRHKPGRRCTIRYDVTDGGAAPARLYGKTHASGRGPAVHAALQVLAGGDLPPGSPTVPAPVRWLDDLRVTLQREVPGTPVTPGLLVGDREVAERIADALFHLHRSDASLPRRHGILEEFAPLPATVDRLAAANPRLGSRARECLEAVLRHRDEPWAWRYMPLHRDLYHDQVLGGPDGISFIDLDDAALGEPAVDVANFAAHLRLLAIQDGAAEFAVGSSREAFLARYASLDAALDSALVRLLEGATLLRLAGIHQPRADGDRVAGELLAAAAAQLGEPGASGPHAEVTGSRVTR